MFQLQVLSGKAAGRSFPTRRFPFSVGRQAGSDLTLDEPGLWPAHFRLDLDRAKGCVLVRAGSGAKVAVNGDWLEEAPLRNGDLIEAGGLKLRFGLGDVRQKSLWFREWTVWVGAAGLTALQLALIYWVLP
jgi:hypothetical protein